MEQVGSVLFACTMNSVRSPMAEALMKHFHGRAIWVQSVGVRAGHIDPFAIAVMEEIGIDISRHKSRSFEDLEIDEGQVDVAISLSPEAHHHALEMTRTSACQVEFWNMFDPSVLEGDRESRLAAYRQLRDDLRRRILLRFPLAPAAVMGHPGQSSGR